jgi:hypothetical protein
LVDKIDPLPIKEVLKCFILEGIWEEQDEKNLLYLFLFIRVVVLFMCGRYGEHARGRNKYGGD